MPVRWRGARGDGDAFEDTAAESRAGLRLRARMVTQVRGGKPEAAHRLLKAAKGLPQDDIDRLSSYVLSPISSTRRTKRRSTLAEETVQRGGAAQTQSRWTAGLASYRMKQFERAAEHFEALAHDHRRCRAHIIRARRSGPARSWMRAGKPERVVPLYEQAAAERGTFYGMLASRLLGRDMGMEFSEPQLDDATFAQLMQSGAARRAVALWQVGRKDAMSRRSRPRVRRDRSELDEAYAGLARQLGVPSLELRAAETAAERDVLSDQPLSDTALPAARRLHGRPRRRARLRAAGKPLPNGRAVARRRARRDADHARDGCGHHRATRSLARRNRARLDDPVYSMTLGQDYLRDLLDRQSGNLFSLAAAYNAGPGSISRWMSLHEGMNDSLLFIETCRRRKRATTSSA